MGSAEKNEFGPDSKHANSKLHYLWQLLHNVKMVVLSNPLYTGRLFQCYMLDKFICQCRGVRSILSLFNGNSSEQSL